MKEKGDLSYIRDWQKRNTVLVGVRMNKTYDADILRFLEEKTNKGGYIKELIRKDMAK